MSRMTERVAVLKRTQTGTDSMGEPTYEWKSEVVDKVLVSVSGVSVTSNGFSGRNTIFTSGDTSFNRRYEGAKTLVTLAFPMAWAKTKPDGYLRNARIALIDRGMDANDPEQAFYVSGIPMRSSVSPNTWGLSVEAWKASG